MIRTTHIFVHCPKCDTTHLVTCSHGNYTKHYYTLTGAPDDALHAVNQQNPFQCHECSTMFCVDIKQRKEKLVEDASC